jgi:topoisomerase-4 subunit A
VAVFARNDDRTIYNMVYQDGPKGNIMMKRFPVTGVTRDKEYDLTRGNKGSRVWYLTANPNGESEVVTVMLKPLPNIKKTQFDIDFSELTIKGRNSQGNIVTKYAVKKITQKQKGLSTLGARMIWFDDSVQRLNVDARGTYLGDFSGDDRILSVSQKGYYRLHNFDLSNHFDEDLVLIEKFDSHKPLTVVYYDGIKKEYFVKRFVPELTDKIVSFLPEGEGSYAELITTQSKPEVEIYYVKSKGKNQPDLSIKLYELEDVKNIKAKGKKLGAGKFKEMNLKPDENEAKPKPEDAPPEAKVDFDRITQIRQQLDDMDNQMTLDF